MMAFGKPSGKASSVLALEFGPSTIRFVEMLAEGNPACQVLSAGIVALEADDDYATHVDRIRAVLAQTGTPGTLIASLPLRHAFLRRIDIPAGIEDIPSALRWDMTQYLARPLDWYALDFQPMDKDPAGPEGAQHYLAAAYRLSEVESLRAALAEAGAPAPIALDIDALAIVNVFAANYPECLPERTLIIKADALATTLFRTRHGEYLGGAVQRENIEVPFHAMEPQERAEHLLHRARMITLGLGGALGGANGWSEAERIFLCGDLAGDADFRELLKTGMRAPFALLNPFRTIPGPNPEAYPAVYPGAPFAAAVGLALRAASERKGTSAPRGLNLLRHLQAPDRSPASVYPEPAEGSKEPKPPRRAKRPSRAKTHATIQRVLITLALLILAGAAGLALKNPQWVGRHLKLTAPAPKTDTLRLSLEREASRLVAGRQAAAIAWLDVMETALPPDTVPGARADIRVTLAAFTAPDAFVLRGVARSPETLSALQETLVLVPGLDMRRSEMRPVRPSVEFLFSGAFTASPDRSLSQSKGKVANRVLSRAEIDAEMLRFLDAAASAGINFTPLPAAAPTASGALQAIPYKLSAKLSARPAAPAHPALLREFLENEYRRDSPFGIQRVLLENSPDSQVVSLDIMAFSR